MGNAQCDMENGVKEDEKIQQGSSSKKANKDFRDVKAKSSSPSSDDETNSVSFQTSGVSVCVHAQVCRLRRRLADSHARASQLELQLAKTHRLLDAANKRLAENSDLADGDTRMPRGDHQRRSAGACCERGNRLHRGCTTHSPPAASRRISSKTC